MTRKKTENILFAILALALSMGAGIIVFYLVKWFESFIVQHAVLILSVVAAAIGVGLYFLFPHEKRRVY